MTTVHVAHGPSRLLEGKVAIVTGASRGIGAAIAERFAAEGARVVITARTYDENSRSPYPGTLSDTAARITSFGGDVTAVAADLSSRDDRRRIVETALTTHGGVDLLVNNAAASWAKPFLEFTDKQVTVMFDVHVRAAFELTQLVVPSMTERGGGAIVNMTSSAARPPQGPPYVVESQHNGTLVYAMCKAALERFTEGLAAELYERHITVNALAPTKSVLTYGMNHPPVPEGRDDLVEPVGDTAAAVLALCVGSGTGLVTHTAAVLGASGPYLGAVVRAGGEVEQPRQP